MQQQQTLAAALLATVLAAVPAAAFAADPPAAPAQPSNEQVVVPQVERRDVRLPRFPSKDFEIGAFAGTYATQSFGTNAVGGLRVGYHLTEDFFVEAAYGQTKVSDETFRQIFAGQVLEENKLKYYNLSAGFNVLPGEVFIGSNLAKASSIYLIGGVGSTSFNKQRRQTFNFGLGVRVLFLERFAVRVDLRDHVFPYDLLGTRQSTKNLELTAGLSYYF